MLNQNTSTREAGDEPVLIYQRTGAPVAIAPKRAEAVQALLQQQPLDAIITDDGLQHYALQRDFELVVIDGVRRFGNGWWLPAGPMRERAARLGSVDACVANGGVAQAGEIAMRLQARDAVNLLSGERRPAAELPRVVAMAGIGHPPRFFATLEKLNVEVVQEVAFADHQEYQQPQLTGLVTAEQTLLMTEKDAVKCRAFAQPNWWYLPVDAVLPSAQAEQLLQDIESLLTK